MRKPPENIKLQSFEEALGIDDLKSVIELPITDLHAYEGHTFKVLDEELDKLISSIETEGILSPVIVRNRAAGGYELVSGHRRKRACEILGLEKMPAIIKELTDDEADIFMVDSNISREKIRISEKARSYKKRYEAQKHQGKAGGNSLEEIGKLFGESGKTVQRYMLLANLCDGLLDLIDTGMVGVRQGVSLSYIDHAEQLLIYNVIVENKVKISMVQAEELKILFENDALDLDSILDIVLLCQEEKDKKDFVIPYKKISEYLSEDISSEEVINLFIEYLKAKKEKQI